MHETPASIQQPPTIYDVAQASGVSIASVSRAERALVLPATLVRRESCGCRTASRTVARASADAEGGRRCG